MHAQNDTAIRDEAAAGRFQRDGLLNDAHRQDQLGVSAGPSDAQRLHEQAAWRALHDEARRRRIAFVPHEAQRQESASDLAAGMVRAAEAGTLGGLGDAGSLGCLGMNLTLVAGATTGAQANETAGASAVRRSLDAFPVQ